MYRITSPLDLYTPFTKGLLTEAQFKDWEQFKKDEIVGRTDEEIKNIHKDVESKRLQRWATAMGLGVDPVQSAIKKGEKPNIPINYVPENRFFLPEGESIVSEKVMNEIKAETRCKIAKIVAENGRPVTAGQSLFYFEPAS